jgi:hypothetical protein
MTWLKHQLGWMFCLELLAFGVSAMASFYALDEICLSILPAFVPSGAHALITIRGIYS